MPERNPSDQQGQQGQHDQEQSGVARKTTRAVFWNYATFASGKLMVLITMAILARLLTPAEFGLVALAMLVITYLSVLKNVGLGEALIHRRDRVEEAAGTVFTLNLMLATGLSVVTMLAAPSVAAFFREPAVAPILRVLALTFFLNGLGSVHMVRLQRELAFERKLIPETGNALVKGVVSIVCALAGLGAWSLVIGQLAGTVTLVVLAWVVFPWVPRLTIDFSLVRSLLRYGLPLLGSTAITDLSDNLDYLIIGRVLGNTALGIYTLAYRLPELLALNVLYVTAQVIFPAYASVQHQRAVLRKGFLATMRFVEIIILPVCVGLVLAADPLVRVAFGSQWLEAIPVVRLIALFILVRSIGYHVGDVYKAVGRTDILVGLDVLHLALLAPSLWFGARAGLVGVALAHLVISLISMVIYLTVAMRFLDVRFGDMLRELKPAFSGGAALVLAGLLVLSLTNEVFPLLRLVVLTVVGAATYAGVLWLVERETLQRMIEMVGLPSLRRKKLPSKTGG
jgi:PST family polysaccharide transporter